MKHVVASIRDGVIKGLVVTIPGAVTIFAIVKLFAFTDNILPGLIHNIIPSSPMQWPNGVGLLLTLGLLWAIGLVASRSIGALGISLLNSILAKIPYINKLFLALHQITNTFGNKKGSVFQRAVLVPYPTHDSYSVGFVNGDAGNAVSRAMGEEKTLAVFVPTTPNPSSGFLLYIAESKVKELNISVETAIKMVVAAGTVTAEELEHEPEVRSKEFIRNGKWVGLLQGVLSQFNFPKKK